MKHFSYILLCITALILSSCEKMITDDTPADTTADKNVIISISGFDKTQFTNNDSGTSANATRSSVSITELCSKISFAIFKGTEKVSKDNQSKEDVNFGQFAAKLDEGTYDIVVIAHNGDGNATISSKEKVTFDGRITDTFYYIGQLTVGAEPVRKDITLSRCVAMFRLVLKDAIPDDVKQMKFYCTNGASSTFNPTTGKGSVKSLQTTYINCTNDDKTFEIYTFPYEDTTTMTIKISALDSGSNAVKEHLFTNVPIAVNTITQYSGSFFADNATNIGMYAESDWESTVEYTF